MRIITFFLLLVGSLNAQIDTNKRYIEGLKVLNNFSGQHIKMTFQNKHHELICDGDSVANLAFFYKDTVIFKFQSDSINFEIRDFTRTMEFCDFTHKIFIYMPRQQSSCTQIQVNDSRGYEYYMTHCTGEVLDPPIVNLVQVISFGILQENQEIYRILER